MPEFNKYPSIAQFRSVVKRVKDMTAYKGHDEETNQAIMDYNIPLPTLSFKGTVKAHGTNAGVGYDPTTGEIWAQKRTDLCTVERDNAGFAFFVEKNKDAFGFLFSDIYALGLGDSRDIITLYGEWCGGNIQKGVGLSELSKRFIMFGLKVGEKEEHLPFYLDDQDADIWNINFFDTYSMAIDFSCPERVQNELGEITLAVEEECPIAKAFDVSGIGEGVVWESEYLGEKLRFKVKGEKHSATQVKKLAKVDTEKLASVDKFVEYAVTENRLKQGIEQVFTSNDEEIDIKKMGVFLKWIMGDICKEELDTLKDNNLEPKDVAKRVSNKAREFFMEEWNTL